MVTQSFDNCRHYPWLDYFLCLATKEGGRRKEGERGRRGGGRGDGGRVEGREGIIVA